MKTMSVSIDDQLYHRVKQAAGPRGMSRFISEAVQAKLCSTENDLRKEYAAAERDRSRRKELADWDGVDGEGW